MPKIQIDNPTIPDFSYKVKKGEVILTDLNEGSMSLTNGIEKAINIIKEQIGDQIYKLDIGYYDSDDDFCWVTPIWNPEGECVDVNFVMTIPENQKMPFD